MPFQFTWLPTLLLNAGLKVAEVDGWVSLGVVRDGRPDLSGPLAQLGLGRDRTLNTDATGARAEPWRAVQLDAYKRGVATILTRIARETDEKYRADLES